MGLGCFFERTGASPRAVVCASGWVTGVTGNAFGQRTPQQRWAACSVSDSKGGQPALCQTAVSPPIMHPRPPPHTHTHLHTFTPSHRYSTLPDPPTTQASTFVPPHTHNTHTQHIPP
eukprot:354365-Chlamydomonas_euryale.AAC.2